MKICARDGCEKKAKYYPTLILVPLEDKTITRQAQMVLELPICFSHRREVTIEMLMPTEVWGSVCKAFMGSGKPVPDRNRIGLAWTAIEGYVKTPGKGQIVTDYEDPKFFKGEVKEI